MWCLTSGVNSNVVYHIDYAELYRYVLVVTHCIHVLCHHHLCAMYSYETNIIHPPLVGGVYHLSPFLTSEDMRGGQFLMNVEGLEHYKKFGYKGRFLIK